MILNIKENKIFAGQILYSFEFTSYNLLCQNVII